MPALVCTVRVAQKGEKYSTVKNDFEEREKEDEIKFV